MERYAKTACLLLLLTALAAATLATARTTSTTWFTRDESSSETAKLVPSSGPIQDATTIVWVPISAAQQLALDTLTTMYNVSATTTVAVANTPYGHAAAGWQSLQCETAFSSGLAGASVPLPGSNRTHARCAVLPVLGQQRLGVNGTQLPSGASMPLVYGVNVIALGGRHRVATFSFTYYRVCPARDPRVCHGDSNMVRADTWEQVDDGSSILVKGINLLYLRDVQLVATLEDSTQVSTSNPKWVSASTPKVSLTFRLGTTATVAKVALKSNGLAEDMYPLPATMQAHFQALCQSRLHAPLVDGNEGTLSWILVFSAVAGIALALLVAVNECRHVTASSGNSGKVAPSSPVKLIQVAPFGTGAGAGRGAGLAADDGDDAESVASPPASQAGPRVSELRELRTTSRHIPAAFAQGNPLGMANSTLPCATQPSPPHTTTQEGGDDGSAATVEVLEEQGEAVLPNQPSPHPVKADEAARGESPHDTSNKADETRSTAVVDTTVDTQCIEALEDVKTVSKCNRLAKVLLAIAAAIATPILLHLSTTTLTLLPALAFAGGALVLVVLAVVFASSLPSCRSLRRGPFYAYTLLPLFLLAVTLVTCFLLTPRVTPGGFDTAAAAASGLKSENHADMLCTGSMSNLFTNTSLLSSPSGPTTLTSQPQPPPTLHGIDLLFIQTTEQCGNATTCDVASITTQAWARALDVSTAQVTQGSSQHGTWLLHVRAIGDQRTTVVQQAASLTAVGDVDGLELQARHVYELDMRHGASSSSAQAAGTFSTSARYAMTTSFGTSGQECQSSQTSSCTSSQAVDATVLELQDQATAAMTTRRLLLAVHHQQDTLEDQPTWLVKQSSDGSILAACSTTTAARHREAVDLMRFTGALDEEERYTMLEHDCGDDCTVMQETYMDQGSNIVSKASLETTSDSAVVFKAALTRQDDDKPHQTVTSLRVVQDFEAQWAQLNRAGRCTTVDDDALFVASASGGGGGASSVGHPSRRLGELHGDSTQGEAAHTITLSTLVDALSQVADQSVAKAAAAAAVPQVPHERHAQAASASSSTPATAHFALQTSTKSLEKGILDGIRATVRERAMFPQTLVLEQESLRVVYAFGATRAPVLVTKWTAPATMEITMSTDLKSVTEVTQEVEYGPFRMTTLVRAVVETPAVVRMVLKFGIVDNFLQVASFDLLVPLMDELPATNLEVDDGFMAGVPSAASDALLNLLTSQVLSLARTFTTRHVMGAASVTPSTLAVDDSFVAIDDSSAAAIAGLAVPTLAYVPTVGSTLPALLSLLLSRVDTSGNLFAPNTVIAMLRAFWLATWGSATMECSGAINDFLRARYADSLMSNTIISGGVSTSFSQIGMGMPKEGVIELASIIIQE